MINSFWKNHKILTTYSNSTYKVNQNEVKKIPMVPGLCSRSSLWMDKQCHGELIRSICHLAQDDLKILYKENLLKNGQPDCFIANKFNIEIDPTAPICVTRRLNNGLSFTDIE